MAFARTVIVGRLVTVTAAFVAAASACCSPGIAGAVAPGPAKAQIMIVGVAHLVARHDVHNSQFTDDPLGPKRQAEISAVVGRLAQFRPTKVLVEAPDGDSATIAQYAQYTTGNYDLPASEVYQFGFRLARAAGNETIYPIDTFGPSIVDDKSANGKAVAAYLEVNLKTVADPTFERYVSRQDELERSGTYLQLLRYLNSEEAIRANASWYSVIAGMGRSDADAGATYVAQWYTRNTFIFSNILNVVKPPDRAVVIIGQGHEYLLREFARLSPVMDVVDPLAFLR